MDDLRRFAFLAAVVEAGSMSAAARALGTSTSAISQQLRQLEREGGVTLLHRTTRRLALTEAGERVHAECAALLAAARRARAQLAVSRDAPTGELRLSATVGFARHVAPALGALLAAHPALTLARSSQARAAHARGVAMHARWAPAAAACAPVALAAGHHPAAPQPRHLLVQVRHARHAAAEHDDVGVQQVDHRRPARAPAATRGGPAWPAPRRRRRLRGLARWLRPAARWPVAAAWSRARPGPLTSVSMQPAGRSSRPAYRVFARRPRAAGCGPIRRPGRWARAARARAPRCRRRCRCRGWRRTPRRRRRRHRRSLRSAPGSWRRWPCAPARCSRAAGRAAAAGRSGRCELQFFISRRAWRCPACRCRP
jgi:DNA-binding transcriptional LysR family regulator